MPQLVALVMLPGNTNARLIMVSEAILGVRASSTFAQWIVALQSHVGITLGIRLAQLMRVALVKLMNSSARIPLERTSAMQRNGMKAVLCPAITTRKTGAIE